LDRAAPAVGAAGGYWSAGQAIFANFILQSDDPKYRYPPDTPASARAPVMRDGHED
jgi:hypothetical protein